MQVFTKLDESRNIFQESRYCREIANACFLYLVHVADRTLHVLPAADDGQGETGVASGVFLAAGGAEGHQAIR